jgi:outer membrane protein insertion porin family
MKKLIIILILHSFFLFFQLYGARLNYDDKKIASVTIRGNHFHKDKLIKKQLTYKRSGFFGRQKRFSARLLRQDLEKIKNLYVAEGFLSVSLRDSVALNQNDAVEIFIIIKEGEQAFLRNFSITGNEKISDEAILKILKPAINKAFRPFDYQERLYQLGDYYANKGMPYVLISERQSNQPDLIWDIEIQNEELTWLNEIVIESGESVRKSTILREITIEKDQLYSLDALLETRRRIFELGVFNNVTINTLETSLKDSTNIGIVLSESRNRLWNMNFGVQQGRIEEVNQTYLFSQADWTHKNLWRRAHRFSVQANMNLLWEQIQNFRTPQPSYNAEIRYTVPWLWFLRLPTTAKVYHRKDVYSPFSELLIEKNDELTSRGFELSSWWRYRDRIQVQTAFTLRQVESLLTLNRNELQRKLSLFWRYDSRDNFLFPRKGWNWQADIQTVDGLSTQASDYIVWNHSLTRYEPLGSAGSAAFRSEFGRVHNFTAQAPLYAMFRLGTENTVRGWSQSIGQAYQTSDDNTVFAGYAKALFNLEFRFPLWNFIGGELFADAGQLEDDFSKVTDFQSYYISFGAGLTFKTFVGPIRAEFPLTFQDPSGKYSRGEPADLNFILALLYAF